MKNTISRIINFGKIDFDRVGKKRNLVTVKVELRLCGNEETFRIVNGKREYSGERTPQYEEFTACAFVWNNLKIDCIAGGQCLDTINEYRDQLADKELWDDIYYLWQNYHLNGMNAGTPEQEKAIEEWKQAGHRYDYIEACSYLKSIGLYEVNFTGITVGRRYNNEPYKYGHGWVVQELPIEVLEHIKDLLKKEDRK